MLALAAFLAVQTGTPADSLEAVLVGLAGSSPVAGVLLLVVRRQWQQQDLDRQERLAEAERDRAERNAERERDLQTQERTLAALFQSAEVIRHQTEGGREMTAVLIRVEALLR